MKNLLITLLLPLSCLAQTDSLSDFYSKDNKMYWMQSYEAIGKDSPTLKQELIEQLEELDGIEILNSSNPDVIRGRMKGVLFNVKQYIIGEMRVTTDAEFRITLKYEGYEVKASSIFINMATGAIAGNTRNSFESLNLKNDGRIHKAQKRSLENWSSFFSGIFKLKTQ